MAYSRLISYLQSLSSTISISPPLSPIILYLFLLDNWQIPTINWPTYIHYNWTSSWRYHCIYLLCQPYPSKTFSFPIFFLPSLSLHQPLRQQILHIYTQHTTPLQFWCSLSRSKQKITMATDGGLKHTAATFDLKIMTTADIVLYVGAGLVDRHFGNASSTCSDLFGMYASLLILQYMARFWSLKHCSCLHLKHIMMNWSPMMNSPAWHSSTLMPTTLQNDTTIIPYSLKQHSILHTLLMLALTFRLAIPISLETSILPYNSTWMNLTQKVI